MDEKLRRKVGKVTFGKLLEERGSRLKEGEYERESMSGRRSGESGEE